MPFLSQDQQQISFLESSSLDEIDESKWCEDYEIDDIVDSIGRDFRESVWYVEN